MTIPARGTFWYCEGTNLTVQIICFQEKILRYRVVKTNSHYALLTGLKCDLDHFLTHFTKVCIKRKEQI